MTYALPQPPPPQTPGAMLTAFSAFTGFSHHALPFAQPALPGEKAFLSPPLFEGPLFLPDLVPGRGPKPSACSLLQRMTGASPLECDFLEGRPSGRPIIGLNVCLIKAKYSGNFFKNGDPGDRQTEI